VDVYRGAEEDAVRCITTPPGQREGVAWGVLRRPHHTGSVFWAGSHLGPHSSAARCDVYADAVFSIAYSPDGKSLAAGTSGGDIFLLDVATRRVLAAFRAHPHLIASLVFTADGRSLLSGGEDQTLKRWELAPLQRILRLSGHAPFEAWCVAFSPDGKVLASAGDDHAVRLWDAATGRALSVLSGHDSLVTAVAFSPDGKVLASASFDRRCGCGTPPPAASARSCATSSRCAA
jgi:WD40 repeat protein